MARRGEDTLRYGPMKPVGLKDPKTGKEPYAVVQLRKDNALGSVYNLVGFQTHLKFPEQKRVFSMIPALHDAEFVRYGVMHRNTFLDSPRLLDRYYADRRNPLVAFAGQMTGVEGYVESTASGYPVSYTHLERRGALCAQCDSWHLLRRRRRRVDPLFPVPAGIWRGNGPLVRRVPFDFRVLQRRL